MLTMPWLSEMLQILF